MKKAIELFDQLQEPFRSQAIENTSATSLLRNYHSISAALANSFHWGSTKQGDGYWDDVYQSLRAIESEALAA